MKIFVLTAINIKDVDNRNISYDVNLYTDYEDAQKEMERTYLALCPKFGIALEDAYDDTTEYGIYEYYAFIEGAYYFEIFEKEI